MISLERKTLERQIELEKTEAQAVGETLVAIHVYDGHMNEVEILRPEHKTHSEIYALNKYETDERGKPTRVRVLKSDGYHDLPLHNAKLIGTGELEDEIETRRKHYDKHRAKIDKLHERFDRVQQGNMMNVTTDAEVNDVPSGTTVKAADVAAEIDRPGTYGVRFVRLHPAPGEGDLYLITGLDSEFSDMAQALKFERGRLIPYGTGRIRLDTDVIVEDAYGDDLVFKTGQSYDADTVTLSLEIRHAALNPRFGVRAGYFAALHLTQQKIESPGIYRDAAEQFISELHYRNVYGDVSRTASLSVRLDDVPAGIMLHEAMETVSLCVSEADEWRNDS